MIIVVYVLVYYNQITVDPSIFEFMSGQSSLFGGEMSIVLIALVVILVVERYSSRTDTKVAKTSNRLGQKDIDEDDKEGGEFHFKKSDLFYKASTSRSMTLRLKTMKTNDIDIQGNSAQEYLQQTYGNKDGTCNFDFSQSDVTS